MTIRMRSGACLNLGTGQSRRLSYEETALGLAEARIAELERKLWIARWDAEHYKKLAEDIRRNTWNLAREERSRLAAVRMDDLRRALGVDVF